MTIFFGNILRLDFLYLGEHYRNISESGSQYVPDFCELLSGNYSIEGSLFKKEKPLTLRIKGIPYDVYSHGRYDKIVILGKNQYVRVKEKEGKWYYSSKGQEIAIFRSLSEIENGVNHSEWSLCE